MEFEIKSIVDGLNREPFRQKLTLVAFAQKSPLELLQCVNDVFVVLDPKHQKDLRDEHPDTTAIRFLEFLTLLQYKIDDLASFKESLMKGDVTIVYPLLRWLLEKRIDLKTRADIGKYLRPIEVPEEMFAEPAIVAAFQRGKELQNEYKDIHKIVHKERGSSVNPSELEAECKQLELERDQLTAKMARLREKHNGSQFEEVLQATNALRSEQEEELKQQHALREQKQALVRNEHELRTLQARLKELEASDQARADPMTLLNRLRDQVRQQRALCDEKLEKDLREKERGLREVEHELTADPISEDLVAELEAEANAISRAISDLSAKRDALHNSGDGQIGFIRDRYAATEKRRQKVLEQLAELDEEKIEAENDLKRIATELKGLLVNGEKPKTEAQMKQYTKDLQKKTNTYKQLKQELQYEKDEVAVLMKTEEVLRSRVQNVQEVMEQLERDRGVQGFQATHDTLEQVSAQTAAVNTAKAQTLEEISAMVKNISAELKQRKNKLAPQIKELRAVRSKYESVESVYSQKKKAYDAIAASIQSDRVRLEHDVQGNIGGIIEDESHYHFLNVLNGVWQAKVEQVTQEQKFLTGSGRFDADYKTYKDKYDKTIADEEALAKRLREEKKNIKETHEDNVGQRQMYLHLRRLLASKIRTNKDAQTENDMRRVDQVDLDQNILQMEDEGEPGVDRLVVD